MSIIPNNLVISEKEEKEGCISSFIFENLPKRSGLTIGTFLRRILLEKLEGVALFAIKITNNNESVKTIFNTLEGVDELGIVTHLISRLKKIVLEEESFKKAKKEIISLELEETAEKKKDVLVTTENFKSKDKIVIKSPVSTLFNLNSPIEEGKKNKIKIELFYRMSSGFDEVEGKEDEKKKKELLNSFFSETGDAIILDADYSPVKLVNPQIEETATGHEKLLLKIETNGSKSPKKALSEAVKLGQNTLNLILENLEK